MKRESILRARQPEVSQKCLIGTASTLLSERSFQKDSRSRPRANGSKVLGLPATDSSGTAQGFIPDRSWSRS